MAEIVRSKGLLSRSETEMPDNYCDAAIPRHSEFLLPSGEKVRMRGSFCATFTLALSLKGEGMLESWCFASLATSAF